jgi:regulator of sigma E protease
LPDAESFARLPLRSRILFSLGGPVANILGAFVCLAGMNAVHSGVSINTIIYLPLEQIGKMATQLVSAIPLLFSQPGQISGIVGIVAAGGAHVGLDFGRLIQFSVLLNLNLAIFNMLPILPLDGGKIVMGVLHKIYRPLRKLEMPLTVGGWVALLALMLYATALDIARVAHGVLA